MILCDTPRLSPQQAREIAPIIFAQLPPAVGFGGSDLEATISPLRRPLSPKDIARIAAGVQFSILLSL